MAGQIGGSFKEKLSPFLKNKLESETSIEIKDVIQIQYIKSPLEEKISQDESDRHYHAEILPEFEGKALKGVERLYHRTILIEPTTACAAHCRWCLRGQYDLLNLSEDDLIHSARYIGSKECHEVREVLITGGDPLMVPDRLNVFIDSLVEYAKQVKIVRIGTRVPLHAPERVHRRLLHALRKRDDLRIELATHINSHHELFPECREAYYKIQEQDIRIYNQSVLLKGLNDNKNALVQIFDNLRDMNIESHYLFHCIPMQGMLHHRTSLNKGVQLIRSIVNSGLISGRCKPMFTAMTDLGKITLYEGVIVERKKDKVLLQTEYLYEERKKWNPNWEANENIVIGKDGRMSVWYLDAND